MAPSALELQPGSVVGLFVTQDLDDAGLPVVLVDSLQVGLGRGPLGEEATPWIGQPLAGAAAAVVDPEGGHAGERTRAVGQLSGFR
jgi:hypothetical protein